MVSCNISNCPNCRGKLKHYDTVNRIIRTRGRVTENVTIRRLRCTNCGILHREIPDYIYPYKQYEAEIIDGVLEGFITPETFGFEDYPCEMTMTRWKSRRKDFNIPGQLRFNFDMEIGFEFIFSTDFVYTERTNVR